MKTAPHISDNIHKTSPGPKHEGQNHSLVFEKDYFERVFDSISSGIIVLDKDGVVLSANPYALDILGYAIEELTGSPLDTIIPGILSKASDTRSEGTFVLSNQKEINIGFSTSQFNCGTHKQGIIILFRDIAEIVDLRNKSNRKEYFTAIGKIASWIAHEVRNPIFVIGSVTRILLKQLTDPGQGKFLTSILNETRSLNNLVDDLLVYGKPLELKFEMVDISEYISEITEEMKSTNPELDRIIKHESDNNKLEALIDKGRIKQVLHKLINNSIEAEASMVRISTGSFLNNIRVSVIDNGRGIKPDHIDKMFMPFITTKKNGTGLGLSICKKIVEDHGGTIQISSNNEGVHIQMEFQRPKI